MTRLTGQRVFRAVSHGVPARTAARRMLRSLNSLGVIVADSAAAARDTEASSSRAALHRLQ